MVWSSLSPMMVSEVILQHSVSSLYHYERRKINYYPTRARMVPVVILTAILLFYGAANFFGAIIARFLIDKNLSWIMVAMSFLMSIVTGLLIFLGGNMILASLFIAVWGFAFGSVQVGWPTWITLAVPDEAESGGSVLVATTQLAITIGAGMGGLVFDHVGIEGTFGLGSLVWLCAAWAIWRTMKGRVWKAASTSGGMVHL